MKYLILALTLLSTPALAGDSYQLLSSPLDFVAPSVYNRTNVTEAGAGTIVYDAASGAFFGLAPGGNPSSAGSWLQLGGAVGGGAPNVSASSAGNEHLERARLTSSCSVTSQSGSWISSTSKSTTGTCVITIASGIFNATPTCTCANEGGSTRACTVTPASSTSVTTYNSVNGSGLDDDPVSVICMGSY